MGICIDLCRFPFNFEIKLNNSEKNKYHLFFN